ncbi:MAG: hypothetical protein JWM91_4722 [Rhodospirillales bacterium]|nr:hypothetical protein [Rhodospirillales bacterium]
MSQNRQAAMDRYRAESNYEVNLHAALELRFLHQKLNAIHQCDVADVRQALARIEQRLGPETTRFSSSADQKA